MEILNNFRLFEHAPHGRRLTDCECWLHLTTLISLLQSLCSYPQLMHVLALSTLCGHLDGPAHVEGSILGAYLHRNDS